MKVCAISDLHGKLPKIEECDVVLIAGDIVPLYLQFKMSSSTVWFLNDFVEWIKELPCKQVYMVAGNHDFVLEKAPFIGYAIEELVPYKFNYLKGGQVYEIPFEDNTYTIYGTPYCHQFGEWAFMETEGWLQGYFYNIPYKIDIILSHDTPYLGDLDLLPNGKHVGGLSLANAIKEKKPRYVFCGHLHECKDKYLKLGRTEIYNVSILDDKYHMRYQPTYVEI